VDSFKKTQKKESGGEDQKGEARQERKEARGKGAGKSEVN